MESRTYLGSNHQPVSYCKFALQIKLATLQLSAVSYSASSILIMILPPVVFDQLFHMVVHSRDLTSHIDELQRIARNIRGPAHHHDGDVPLQAE